MFPNTRSGQIALALGTLVITLTAVLPPVSFHLTDLGFGYRGAQINFVSDGPHHVAAGVSSPTTLHVGGCKFVGQRGVCVEKEISYDHAHGLRFVASVTTPPPRVGPR